MYISVWKILFYPLELGRGRREWKLVCPDRMSFPWWVGGTYGGVSNTCLCLALIELADFFFRTFNSCWGPKFHFSSHYRSAIADGSLNLPCKCICHPVSHPAVECVHFSAERDRSMAAILRCLWVLQRVGMADNSLLLACVHFSSLWA